MSDPDIRLLALDGGGVRGLSSLFVLRNLMEKVNPECPPKPCEYFDMIGGTSTGGIIAIMLGRLQMTVEECIDVYVSLSDKVFKNKQSWLSWTFKLRSSFDSAKLEEVIKHILKKRGLEENELLKDPDATCKVFVCATSEAVGGTVCIRNYRSPRSDNSDLLNSVTIWQACRATSAATTFFDPIAIGPFGEKFVDGALGANNPIEILWGQAHDVWGDELQNKLQCIVSIGTGVPNLTSVGRSLMTIAATLKSLATETESTAERFHRDKSSLAKEGRYYRFNVDKGLEEIGLEEAEKKDEIAAATRRYVDSQTVCGQMQACASNLAGKKYFGPYRTVFSLSGVPTSSNFIDRPSETIDIENCLIPRKIHSQHSQQLQRKIFILHGLGGIGKTQIAANFARRHKSTFSSVFWLDGRSEDRLKQSLATCAKRIPRDHLPERSQNIDLGSKENLDIVVEDALEWLSRPDNTNWLLIFDNVDYDQQQGGTTSEYDVLRYLPADHGSALITSRLSRLEQIGTGKQLKKANHDLSKAIFEKWYGKELVLDDAGNELLRLLDGLPLALAQAAAYCHEAEIDVEEYVPLYNQQWGELMESDTNSDLPLTDYYRGTVGTTWTITFKAIEQKNQSAANLLRVWAFIANKDMWHGLFEKVAEFQHLIPGWLGEIAKSRPKFLNAVRLLLRFSMAEAQEDLKGSYSIHPVVHKWASYVQDTGDKQKFLQLAVIIVGNSSQSNAVIGYGIPLFRLLPHAERFPSLIADLFRKEWFPENSLVLEAMDCLGIMFWKQNRLEDAEAIIKRALRGYEETRGRGDQRTLGVVVDFGNILESQGRQSEARASFQRAVEGYTSLLGPNHADTINARVLWALVLEDQDRDEAESILRQALQVLEKTLGPDHPDVISTLGKLGKFLVDGGEYDESEGLLQKGLQLSLATLKEDHRAEIFMREILGRLYTLKRQPKESAAHFEKALISAKKSADLDYDTIHRLALCLFLAYTYQGQHTKAAAMREEFLSIFERKLGPRDKYSCDFLGICFRFSLEFIRDQNRRTSH